MTPPIDTTPVPAIAHQQHGVFTRAQALDDGFTRRQVDHRIRAGIWVRVAGRALIHRDTPVDAWVLAHAAWLSRPGCIVVGTVAGSPARLTDLARSCADTFRWEGTVVARNALACARSRDRITADALREDVAAQPRTRGNPQVRKFIEHCESGAMSADEDRAHALLHTHRITGWTADIPLPDARTPVARADIYFDAERLDVEIDRPATHDHRAAQDRWRDERLLQLGIATHRIHADRLVRDDAQVVIELHAVLDARRRELGLPPDRRGRSVQPRDEWEA